MQAAVTRREVLGTSGALAVASAAPAFARSRRAVRPNILFVMADDLGYADLSCYGRRDYETPNSDRLAAEGVLLTQAYASSPVCSPTRVALITGRYPQRLAVGLPEPIRSRALDPVGLMPHPGLLPSIFRQAGYATALVGKWHMGWPPTNGPLACGYDRFFGIAGGAGDYFSHHEYDPVSRGRPGLYEGDAIASRQGYLTDLLADRAIDEIRAAERADKPFFISLHFTAPHWPWQGPRDLASASAIADMRNDGGSLKVYSAMVHAMDAALGRVLRALDQQSAANDTIVIFTSDNGGERFSDNWPHRGGKGELLEGGIRVPAIVRWPAAIRSGTRSPQVMTTIDWLPTLLAAADITLNQPSSVDGENLLPMLTAAAPPRARQLFWRVKQSEQAAMRDGDMKYFRIGDAKEHLYNVADDPREGADLRLRDPATFKRLQAAWANWNSAMLPYTLTNT